MMNDDGDDGDDGDGGDGGSVMKFSTLRLLYSPHLQGEIEFRKQC